MSDGAFLYTTSERRRRVDAEAVAAVKFVIAAELSAETKVAEG